MTITRKRDDENICRQCGLLFEDDCLCRCVDCNANIWPSGRCDYCADRLALEADEHEAMREDEDDARRDADAYAGDR